MVYELKMAQRDAILGLLALGWSHRRIAREVGVNRETVSRYAKLQRSGAKPAISTSESVGAASSNPAISTPGSEGTASSNPAIPTPGSEGTASLNPAISTPGSEGSASLPSSVSHDQKAGRQSHCVSFDTLIRKKIDQDLSAQRIYQDLVADHGFSGSYSSVKRYVRTLRPNTPLPFRRMEVGPGAEAQIDFGQGWWLQVEGKRRKVHILRLILSHSRKGYSEALLKESTQGFLRILENAFHALGGVPETLVPDNMKPAVTKADWYDPELNPIARAFCEHYGTVLLPTRSYSPNLKGKIERGIGFVKDNALKGRTFETLAALNTFLAQWERNVADNRIHGTTRAHVGDVFRSVERPVLRPLPPTRFPIDEEGRRTVHPDGHVEVKRSYYSVPPEYLGRKVWVRWNDRIVRILNDRFEEVALHPRIPKGKFQTTPTHIPPEKRSGIERGVPDMVHRASRIGENAGLWAQELLRVRGIEGIRVLQGFLSLARTFPATQLDQAAKRALASHQFRLRFIREVLARKIVPEGPTLTSSHPQIRPLSEYQSLVDKTAFYDEAFLKED